MAVIHCCCIRYSGHCLYSQVLCKIACVSSVIVRGTRDSSWPIIAAIGTHTARLAGWSGGCPPVATSDESSPTGPPQRDPKPSIVNWQQTNHHSPSPSSSACRRHSSPSYPAVPSTFLATRISSFRPLLVRRFRLSRCRSFPFFFHSFFAVPNQPATSIKAYSLPLPPPLLCSITAAIL